MTKIIYPFSDFYAQDTKGRCDYFSGLATIARAGPDFRDAKWVVLKIEASGLRHKTKINPHYETVLERWLRMDHVKNEEIERLLKLREAEE